PLCAVPSSSSATSNLRDEFKVFSWQLATGNWEDMLHDQAVEKVLQIPMRAPTTMT
ncbi:unnamed protein product, partial [Ceratitis capitata]